MCLSLSTYAGNFSKHNGLRGINSLQAPCLKRCPSCFVYLQHPDFTLVSYSCWFAVRLRIEQAITYQSRLYVSVIGLLSNAMRVSVADQRDLRP